MSALTKRAQQESGTSYWLFEDGSQIIWDDATFYASNTAFETQGRSAGVLMSTVIQVEQPQFIDDIHVYPFDFTDSLLTGVTVSSAAVTYEALIGGTSGQAAGTAVSSPIVNGTFGTVSAPGTYYFDCQATLSNNEKDTIRLIVHRPER